MKKMPNFFLLLLAVALVLGFAGCAVDDDDTTQTGGDVDFQSFAPPSIRVENLTGERLVAFKGTLSPNNLISGIPAYSSVHGLKKDAKLFNATGAFPLVLITEAEYNAKKNSLGSSTVFARIFAFYNHTATNNNVFQISSKIGGDGRLTVSNATPFNVEIRKDGITGEILGYAAANMTDGNVIYLEAPASYDIYPIFKFFSQVDQELYSVVPKYLDGAREGRPFMRTIGFAAGNMTRTFDVNDIYQEGSFNLSSGSAYLKVNNNNTGTDVRFWEGSTPRFTSLGVDVVFSSKAENFTLNFPKDPDGKYPESRTIAGLQIGVNDNRKSVPSFEYELDCIYEIDVTGSTGSNLDLGAIRKVRKVDLDQIFGLTY
jgi:hypothetical protein